MDDLRLILLKPDVAFGHERRLVLGALEAAGVSHVQLGCAVLHARQVGRFYRYQQSNATNARLALTRMYLALRPMEAILVSGLRDELEFKRVVRAQLGRRSWLVNGVHISDSTCDAVREAVLLRCVVVPIGASRFALVISRLLDSLLGTIAAHCAPDVAGGSVLLDVGEECARSEVPCWAMGAASVRSVMSRDSGPH